MIQINIKLNNDDDYALNSALQWCVAKFNSTVDEYGYIGSSRGNYRWAYIGMNTFTFKRDDDAILFALRWV